MEFQHQWSSNQNKIIALLQILKKLNNYSILKQVYQAYLPPFYFIYFLRIKSNPKPSMPKLAWFLLFSFDNVWAGLMVQQALEIKEERCQLPLGTMDSLSSGGLGFSPGKVQVLFLMTGHLARPVSHMPRSCSAGTVAFDGAACTASVSTESYPSLCSSPLTADRR